MTTMTFGGRLRQLRAEARLTQQQLADRVPMPVRTLRSYEHGVSSPPWNTFLALCKTLGVDPWSFEQPHNNHE